jgi:predicted RNA-binding protein with PUA-like domain
MEVGIADVC